MQKTIFVPESKDGDMYPMQLGFEACEPSHKFGPFVRNHWLLHYVISGTGVFFQNGTLHNIKPGEIFVIPPYVETWYQADKLTPWKYIWIGFTSDNVPDVFHTPVISVPNTGPIFDEFLKAEKLTNGRTAFLTGNLWKLVSLLSETTERNTDHVEKALDYIHNNYASPLSVQDIADTIGLNRKYFSRIFAKQMGVPPQEYIINVRMNKAVEYMVKYHQSPSIAATSVGYPDLYTFSKMFKKHFGMSPRNYIKHSE